jgi:predicted nucleotidyltransferase
MNNIIGLFNRNVIDILTLLSKGDFYLRGISETLKISPSATHAAIKRLLGFGFIKVRRQRNRKYFSIDRENILLRRIKSFLNLEKLLNSKAYRKLRLLGNVGIYGSFADGSNDEHSDLDLWVYADKINPSRVSRISSIFEKEFKVETNILILNGNKLKNLKEKDPEFYSQIRFGSIFEGESIFD